ncbi:translocation/assembly module TamB domain-containing protein [Roseibium salinum]|nr:translocation/assembly module TamB domain-containing protein [Roseibium salinum]
MRLTGTASFDGSITGTLAEPDINGAVTTSGVRLFDPTTGVRLSGANLSATIADRTIRISSASATVAAGGRIGVTGSIGIRPEAGFPVDLRVELSEARYVDRELVAATLSGTLTLTGQLRRDPLLAGRVVIDRAEVIVPSHIAGRAATVEVIHRNPPPAVRRTLQKARAAEGSPVPRARPSVVQLDVAVEAPESIFVRGRGVDARLGGSVRLTGSAASIEPVGAFNLVRGRLEVLGRRIVFDEGRVTLVGDLDPFIYFVASTEGGDVAVFINVQGRLSDVNISFSSEPRLPEDEVLARLLFGRGLAELSPAQIGRLALAAAELAGGAETPLLASLQKRHRTGQS